jgi:hypothetical protein
MLNKCSNPQEICDMNFPKQLTSCVCMHEANLKKILTYAPLWSKTSHCGASLAVE